MTSNKQNQVTPSVKFNSGSISPFAGNWASNTKIIEISDSENNSIEFVTITPDYANEGSLKTELNGDVHLHNDVRPLKERIARIEKMLGIPQRNGALEKQYPDLKKIGIEMDRRYDEICNNVRDELSEIADRYTRFERECAVMNKFNKK